VVYSGIVITILLPILMSSFNLASHVRGSEDVEGKDY